ncbi:PTS system protein [Citrobacter braakii]|nr:PTS system protein [Citrobacter braakii]
MIIEATLIGILCYLGALSSPWLLGLTGGWYLITRPLISGMLVGIILGDIKTGIMIGVAVQAVYIAMVTPGGSMPADLNFVAYPAIALGILSGKGPEVAVALAATIGIAGTILFNAMMVLNSFWNHRADVALERGDERGIYLNSAIWPQVTNFVLRFVPTFIAVYFGAQYISGFMDSLPKIVLSTMNVLGGILPAVGIAILLKQIIKKLHHADLLPRRFCLHRIFKTQHGRAGDRRFAVGVDPLQLQTGTAAGRECKVGSR